MSPPQNRGRVPANKGKKYPVEILTHAEVQALMKACSNRAPTGIRNRALIVVLYRGGLRVSEALELRPKDLDPAAGTIRVLKPKGAGRKRNPAQARTTALDPDSFAHISRWLDVRRRMGINGHAPVFCTLEGGKLYSSYVRALFQRLGKRAGIEKRVHPHGLRHTHAAQLAQDGIPMNTIQAQLGHRSLATTSHYLEHIAPYELIETMKNRKVEPL